MAKRSPIDVQDTAARSPAASGPDHDQQLAKGGAAPGQAAAGRIIKGESYDAALMWPPSSCPATHEHQYQPQSGSRCGMDPETMMRPPLQAAAAAAAAATAVEKVGRRRRASFVDGMRRMFRETLFPDNPLRGFRKQPPKDRFCMALAYIFPVLHWGRGYSLVGSFKDDLVAGLTIGSLSIPQGIGYAKLAGLPPIYGLYSSFVPPLVYAALGVSREIAIGPVAVVSILLGTLARNGLPAPVLATTSCDTTSTKFINAECSAYREAYFALIFTATFFTGLFQAVVGLSRLGFIVDYLSHPAIVGFMAGAAITIALQQLKGLLGISTGSFTRHTDAVSVLHSVFTHTNEWNWQTILIGLFFLGFLLLTKHIAKRRPRLFWVSVVAPLTSIILSTLFVKFTHANQAAGVAIVGRINGHINQSSVGQLVFHGAILKQALVVAIQASLIALTEGIAIGRTFAAMRNYNIDGNKEMIAFGAMNMAGACTSCYVVTGSFSRSAVNYSAGVKTPVSNVVMALMVLVVLAVATPLFHYTPNCILASIIINAVLGLLDYEAMYKIWKIDTGDFIAMSGAFLGVVFISVEMGLLIAVLLSLAKILLQVSRPHTAVLGNIPGTNIYRNVEQYPHSIRKPGILIIRIDAAIYFSNANYLRERILRWVDDETETIMEEKGVPIQFLILELSSVTNIDTTGIHSLEDLLTNLKSKNIQLAMANPGVGVVQKLEESGVMEKVGKEWFFFATAEAVHVCSTRLRINTL